MVQPQIKLQGQDCLLPISISRCFCKHIDVKSWLLHFLFFPHRYYFYYLIYNSAEEFQVVKHDPTMRELEKSKIKGELLPCIQITTHGHIIFCRRQKTSDIITRPTKEYQAKSSLGPLDNTSTPGRCPRIPKWKVIFIWYKRVPLQILCKATLPLKKQANITGKFERSNDLWGMQRLLIV